jgi:hypothetical protein
MDIKELDTFYRQNFSLGYLNVDINSKFALISLIDYLTYNAQQKRPDVTHYQIIKAILKDVPEGFPEEFVKGLAVVCKDFAYQCKSFPTFNVAPKDMPETIRGILKNYLPF